MNHQKQDRKTDPCQKDGICLLVATDFSDCSMLALLKARNLLKNMMGAIVLLHVIDMQFVAKVVYEGFSTEGETKARLFTKAKAELRRFARQANIEDKLCQYVVTAGEPCTEINRQAVDHNADIIVMGSRGMAGGMENIFFGSTTERVLRFIKRPILCVPPDEKLGNSLQQAPF